MNGRHSLGNFVPDQVTHAGRNQAAAPIEAAIRIEQAALDDHIERDKRRARMQIELAKVEEESRKRKKYGCSHCRQPMGAGKNAGNAAPKGTGEWTTGGQQIGLDKAFMLCLRCSYSWTWQPTPQELDYIQQNGMLGMAPPASERVIAEG